MAGDARGDAVLGSSLVPLSTQPPPALQPDERLVRRNFKCPAVTRSLVWFNPETQRYDGTQLKFLRNIYSNK